LTEHDETLDRVIDSLKEPVTIDASLDKRIMSEIEGLPAHSAQTARTSLPWRARRWTVRISPFGGLATAAAVGAIAFSAIILSRGNEATPTPEVIADAEIAADAPSVTQFVLVAPDAESVALVGDFNDWSPSGTRLIRQAGDGVWWINVTLPPGRYRYAFIVDGENWRNDPNAPAAEDEFGRANSVITIGGA
jgi:hypothetical protein